MPLYLPGVETPNRTERRRVRVRVRERVLVRLVGAYAEMHSSQTIGFRRNENGDMR